MRVLVLAGEPSGDRLGAGVARALRALDPGVEVAAMGGTHLRAAGAELVVDATDLAVVGLTEVISVLPSLLRARAALAREIAERRPDVLLAVDYPDFNLGIAEIAARAGVPVAWLVSPQVWAWRPNRVRRYARAVSRMLVVFPFETATWQRAGVAVEHVGHPLVDLAPPAPPREEARAALGLAGAGRVLALLPGSRRKEIARTWPVMAAAARALAATRPDLAVVVPLAPNLADDALDLRGGAAAAPAGMILTRAGAGAALAACDVAAVTSGTATLEAALVPRPLVACYRVGALTMALGRRLAEPGFVERGLFSLPNLVLGRAAVTELYQERFTAGALAAELGRLLDDREARAALEADLARVRPALGGPGACERAARAVLDLARG